MRKLWGFVSEVTGSPDETKRNPDSSIPGLRFVSSGLRQTLHQHLQQITFDYERQQFNTVVSGAMKIFNAMVEHPENDAITEGVRILLRILNPIVPHITHALWQHCGFGENILDAPWPQVDSTALLSDTVEYIVQVNGKMRGKISVPMDAAQEVILARIKEDSAIQKHLPATLKKVIVVPKRLVNLVG